MWWVNSPFSYFSQYSLNMQLAYDFYNQLLHSIIVNTNLCKLISVTLIRNLSYALF